MYNALIALEPDLVRRTGLLFRKRDDRAWGQIRRAVESALTKAGIKAFRFLDLRHTAASYLIMRGATLRDVQEILGHADLKMTQRYPHLSPAHLRGAVERLEGLSSGVAVTSRGSSIRRCAAHAAIATGVRHRPDERPRLTRKQRQLVAELRQLMSRLRLAPDEIVAEANAVVRTTYLEIAKNQVIRSGIILKDVLMDAFLSAIICWHYFGKIAVPSALEDETLPDLELLYSRKAVLSPKVGPRPWCPRHPEMGGFRSGCTERTSEWQCAFILSTEPKAQT